MTNRSTIFLLRLGCLAALAFAPAQALACTAYAGELAIMAEAAKAVQERVDYLAPPDDPVAARRRDHALLVERTNVQRFAPLLAACGWPRRSVEGEQALAHAWALATQASSDLGVQRAAAQHLEAAVAAGEAPGRHLAIAADRVAVLEMRAQPYGTQLRPIGQCSWDFYRLDARSKVEERRRALGLPALDDYKRAMNEMAIHENCTPRSLDTPAYAR